MPILPNWRWLALAAVLLISQSVPLRATASDAYFVGLGFLPGFPASAAADVSADGSIVVGRGHVLYAAGLEAFRWDATNGMIGLGGFDSDPPHGSRAAGVSADGSVVVGSAGSLASGDPEAFIWDAVNGMRSLGDLPGGLYQSGSADVSDDGTVVVGHGVVVHQGMLAAEAFIWDAVNGMRGLGDLPGGRFSSAAAAVSADGTVVVGNSSSDAGQEAFIWDATNGMSGLGDLSGGPFTSSAESVSADGSIVVGRGSSSLGVEAFVWSDVDGMVGLGDLGGGPLDTGDYGSPFLSIAFDVSADGSTVVGTAASTFSDGVRRPEAFVWNARDGMRSIRDILTAEGIDLTGWTLDVATAISADGRTIVGTGTRPNERTKEAWLARLPAPELPVEIDIKPGSDPNAINLQSRGVLPVAILGSQVFDVAEIDASTLAFGPEEAPPAHRKGGHFEDVNGDGLVDLVSHYRTQEAGIALGDTEACVIAETVDGVPVRGCDEIAVLPLCGLGFELAVVLPALMWSRRRLAGRLEKRPSTAGCRSQGVCGHSPTSSPPPSP